MEKTIGVVGLGLIGGSMAKAIKKYTTHTVYGYDTNESTVQKALEQGAIDIRLSDDNINKCSYIIVALYPGAAVEYIKSALPGMKKGTVVVDCAGVKGNICKVLSPLCAEQGVYFVGGHPMAGIERSGFDNSFAELYKGASMILCTDKYTNLVALKAAELLFLELGFGQIKEATPDQHDRMIALTSQLAHMASSAYVKSETAGSYAGFSAGSFKDLTRVALLNEDMWTELFFENKKHLLDEAQGLADRLNEYIQALKTDDADKMRQLLKDGRVKKEALG